MPSMGLWMVLSGEYAEHPIQEPVHDVDRSVQQQIRNRERQPHQEAGDDVLT